MSGFSELKYDFIAPKSYGSYRYPQKVDVDTCFGNQLGSGFYHYYSVSPCIFDTSAVKKTSGNKLCSADDSCKADASAYLKTKFTAANANIKKTFDGGLPIVGIARDGHYIIGPMKLDNTTPWGPCDVDACNGVVIDGTYVYVTSYFYPYTVACWGPSSSGFDFKAQCSTNAKVCSDTTTAPIGSNARAQLTFGFYYLLMALAALLYSANFI